MHQLSSDNNPQTTRETTREYFALMAAKYGVPLLAGTQSEDIATAGIIMHVKLYRFVVCGLTPAEALRTVTMNPSIFLNKQMQLGTVDVGKLADLVLLDANPLDDI